MKFFDTLKMALHNLWHNKSRTALTVVIVFVVSSLIMAMCLLGTNFLSNQARANEVILDSAKNDYTLEQAEQVYGSSGLYDDGNTSDYNEVFTVMSLASKHSSVVDKCVIEHALRLENNDGGNADSIFLFLPTHPYSEKIGQVISGRIWTAADEKESNIWVTRAFLESAAKKGLDYSVGKKVSVKAQGDSRDTEVENGYTRPKTLSKTLDVTVAGVIESGEKVAIYAPIALAESLAAEKLAFHAWGFSLTYEAMKGAYNFNEVEKEMSAFTREVNAAVGKGVDGEGKLFTRFTSSFLEQMKMGKIIGYAILGLFAVLSFVILLLSIGSVSNTIIISVDKNKKFIGLMKAMGMRHSGVKKIVYLEATIQIIIGVLLGVLFVFCIQGLLLKLLESMLGVIFMVTLGATEFAYTFSVAFYIPIVTILVFVGMALLFSKGAMARMGKMDVMEIISEAE